MTEEDWLKDNDPQAALDRLRGSGRASDRKLRLFACGYWRRCLPLLYLQEADLRRIEGAVEAAERHAEGLAPVAEMAPLRRLGLGVAAGTGRSAAEGALQSVAQRMRWLSQAPWGYRQWVWTAEREWTAAEGLVVRQATEERRVAVRAIQLSLFRDLFGMSRPAAADASWLAWNDGTVVKLAQAIHNDHRFGDLPILADALEDAGCTNAELLGHLRGPGPHVRGCWVVDLLLGKA